MYVSPFLLILFLFNFKHQRRLNELTTNKQASTFTLDQVYGPTSSTKDIYEGRVSELVQWSVDGGTSMLLAYGQTGSGKTYSVTGLERLLAEKVMGDSEKEVHICVFEVAGNNLFGTLLSPSPNSHPNNNPRSPRRPKPNKSKRRRLRHHATHWHRRKEPRDRRRVLEFHRHSQNSPLNSSNHQKRPILTLPLHLPHPHHIPLPHLHPRHPPARRSRRFRSKFRHFFPLPGTYARNTRNKQVS